MLGYVVTCFVFVVFADCKYKQMMKCCSSRPIRMWIDGKCFNLKQYQRQPEGIEMTNSKTGNVHRKLIT